MVTVLDLPKAEIVTTSPSEKTQVQGPQHAHSTARRPPSVFVLIAPAGVRPSVILAFLGRDPGQRAVHGA